MLNMSTLGNYGWRCAALSPFAATPVVAFTHGKKHTATAKATHVVSRALGGSDQLR